jgi:hypothetical protein
MLILGLELRALGLLGKYSTTGTMPPAQVNFDLIYLLRLRPQSSCFLSAGITLSNYSLKILPTLKCHS